MAIPLIIGASGSSSAPPFISSASALIRPFPTKGTSPASSPLIRPFPSKPGPQWPDWINISSPGFGSKLTSAGLLNERQQPIEDALRTVAGDTRKMGPVYGPTTLGGRVDIIEQIGTYLYIRALLCLGEIEQISSIKITKGTGKTRRLGPPSAVCPIALQLAKFSFTALPITNAPRPYPSPLIPALTIRPVSMRPILRS